MKNSFEVESDCLEIIRQIKAVDEEYFVVYNIKKQAFELHHRAQKGSSYCLTFPFDTLDERAYLHVLKTRVQNSDQIFKKLETENAKNLKTQSKQVLNEFLENLGENKHESFGHY